MLLETRDIGKSFGGHPVLRNISVGFAAGQIHALIGENGAGKSTLMKIIAGILPPDCGHVILEGRRTSWRNPAQAQHAGISLIPQELTLAGRLTVAENIFLGVERSRCGWLKDNDSRRHAAKLIEEYGLEFSADERAASLSPSQQQQVEILRALVRAQKMLVLDEPTAYFSERESRVLFRLMRQLRERGVSLVFITHRLEELEGLADSVTVLRDGACVQSSPFPDTSIDEILSHMVGGNLGRLFPDKTRLPGEVVLSLRGVGLDRRLGNIGFDLKSGEILGLGGFVGAGRTLLAEVLFGLHPRYSGEISLRGRAVRMTSPEQAQVLGIAFVSEDRKRTGVFPQLSVLENVSLLALTRIARRGWIPDTAERAAVLGVIDRLRAQRRDLADPISRLSGGNQQKCVLARWLLTEPWLLILDEPTRGIDVGARVELYNWFNRLAKDGLAILLISSDLRELEGMCDRIAVFREGRLVRMLEGGDANPREVVRYSALT